MVVRISYINPIGERSELEWICPTGYTVERTVAVFKERHPTSTFLAALRLDDPCLR